jgi:hypothetical protein
MSKFVYYNDTGRAVNIHPATHVHGTECDMSPINHGEVRHFKTMEGSIPFVKMWDYGVSHGLQILVSGAFYKDEDYYKEDEII